MDHGVDLPHQPVPGLDHHVDAVLHVAGALLPYPDQCQLPRYPWYNL